MKTHIQARLDIFIQNLDIAIESHLDDPDFTVKKLLRAAGVSRTDLHRKLACSVGMSTTEYLRHKRIQKAAHLLMNRPEWCICQVAMEVGFHSPSYFTQRFREVFGVCPLAYRGEVLVLEHT